MATNTDMQIPVGDAALAATVGLFGAGTGAAAALLAAAARPARVAVVPGATHLFEEAGAPERVADHARAWFDRHLRRDGPVAGDVGGLSS